MKIKSYYLIIVLAIFILFTACMQDENIYRIGSEAKEYVVKDSLGNNIVKGIGFQIDFTKYQPGKYFIYYDDTFDVYIKQPGNQNEK
ncbi:MAG: hypothetical protein Kow0068_15170 [Marinilabiliales bacterium]